MKPTIICLTPVRNEAWILDKFLKATSLWADYIIIADQMSTDGSREIAKSYPKVILVENNKMQFNELERKRLLVTEARKIKGPRLLITLDADEIFSPEIFDSGEWEKVLQLKPGTAIDFQWANIAPDLKKMWKGYFFPWGYMDDDFEEYDKGIAENAIHCARVPITDKTPRYKVESFKVIHFQFTDWERMKHKHYYYQCMEVVNNPKKSAVDIYRQYHHMDVVSTNDRIEIPTEWINKYLKYEIDILEVKKDFIYWFDEEVIKMFDLYGVKTFSKIDIWDTDWNKIINIIDYNLEIKQSLNPYKLLFFLLRKTQQYNNRTIRRIDKLIKKWL